MYSRNIDWTPYFSREYYQIDLGNYPEMSSLLINQTAEKNRLSSLKEIAFKCILFYTKGFYSRNEPKFVISPEKYIECKALFNNPKIVGKFSYVFSQLKTHDRFYKKDRLYLQGLIGCESYYLLKRLVKYGSIKIKERENEHILNILEDIDGIKLKCLGVKKRISYEIDYFYNIYRMMRSERVPVEIIYTMWNLKLV